MLGRIAIGMCQDQDVPTLRRTEIKMQQRWDAPRLGSAKTEVQEDQDALQSGLRSGLECTETGVDQHWDAPKPGRPERGIPALGTRISAPHPPCPTIPEPAAQPGRAAPRGLPVDNP